MPEEALRGKVREAAAGLRYVSESDHPLEWVRFPASGEGAIAVDAFREAAGIPAETPVHRLTVEEFFRSQIEDVDPADEAGRRAAEGFKRLRETLLADLRYAAAFRVGEVEIRAYVVGRAEDGALAGVSTELLET